MASEARGSRVMKILDMLACSASLKHQASRRDKAEIKQSDIILSSWACAPTSPARRNANSRKLCLALGISISDVRGRTLMGWRPCPVNAVSAAQRLIIAAPRRQCRLP